MKYLNCLVLLALISCGSGEVKKDYDPSQPYTTSGTEQFFLPELPTWANFSASGNCFKKSSIQYLNFSKLRESYQLDYAQMLELQAQYNERLENYYQSTAVKFLRPVEQASFFSNTLEQVRSGLKGLKIPKVKEVTVLWFEAHTVDELKKMASTSVFDENYFILLSSCQTKQSLTQILMQANLDGVGFGLVTSEWLAPFDRDFNKSPGLKIFLQDLLGAEMKINFLNTHKKTIDEFILP